MPTDKIDELFQPANRSDVPGAVVAIARSGDILYRRGFGLASVEQGIANTPSTRMRIGSTSKQFTCLAVMLLAEDGLIDVDAPAKTFFPELHGSLGGCTLRQLMSHTSGMRDAWDIMGLIPAERGVPNGWLLKTIFQQEEGHFPPGAGQIYCNAGYHLLSVLVDRVSGEQFESFARRRIFEPLGMIDTECAASDFTIFPRLATLHVPIGDDRYRRGMMPTEEIRGEGSMISTVDDLLRWAGHLRGEKTVGSEETWRQMLTPAVLANGHRSIYALGLHRHDHRGVEVIHHGGAVMGGSCQVLTAPQHELDIVVIANGGPINPIKTAWKILDVLVGEGALAPEAPFAQSAVYAGLAGARYRGASGMDLLIVDAAGQLSFSLHGAPPLVPFREDDSALVVGFEEIALGPLELRGDLKAAAAPNEVMLRDAGQEEVLHLVTRRPVPIEARTAMCGHFHAREVGADAEICLADTGLTLTISGPFGSATHEIDVLTESDVVLTVHGLPYGGASIAFEREGDEVIGFRVSSARARGIFFRRIGR